MGKTAILIVLGLSITLSFVKLSLLRRPVEATENTASYYNNVVAKNIAKSALNNYLLKLNNNKSLRGTFTETDVYIEGGVDTVSIATTSAALSTPETLAVTVTAHYIDQSSTIEVGLIASSFDIPEVTSALAFSGDNPKLNINGALQIDGRNHDLNGFLASNCDDLPGVAVKRSVDSTNMVKKQIKKKNRKKVKGLGSNPSVHVRNTVDPSTYSSLLQSCADYTITRGTYAGHNQYGTQANPAVVYGTGDVHFSGQLSGYGIVVIDGSLKLTGTMDWFGLICVIGSSKLIFSSTGTSRVIGGVVVGGDNKEAKIRGTADLLYSCDAINNFKNNSSSLKTFSIYSWYE